MSTETTKEPVYATSLETAKEGQTVLYSYGHSGHKPVLITRTTPSIIEAYHTKFNREGFERGGSRYGGSLIRVTTAEEVKEIEDENQRRILANTIPEINFWRKLTLEQLRQVHALVSSFKS